MRAGFYGWVVVVGLALAGSAQAASPFDPEHFLDARESETMALIAADLAGAGVQASAPEAVAFADDGRVASTLAEAVAASAGEDASVGSSLAAAELAAATEPEAAGATGSLPTKAVDAEPNAAPSEGDKLAFAVELPPAVDVDLGLPSPADMWP